MNPFHRLALGAVLLLPLVTVAAPVTDALSKCLSDNTTGRDRKDLAAWIFVAMSTHPELGSIAKASAADVESTQRAMGTLVTRLLADACPKETQAVVQAEGTAGMGRAFEELGRMAMQELMSNRQVAANIGGFERFVDKARIEKVTGAR